MFLRKKEEFKKCLLDCYVVDFVELFCSLMLHWARIGTVYKFGFSARHRFLLTECLFRFATMKFDRNFIYVKLFNCLGV